MGSRVPASEPQARARAHAGCCPHLCVPTCFLDVSWALTDKGTEEDLRVTAGAGVLPAPARRCPGTATRSPRAGLSAQETQTGRSGMG